MANENSVELLTTALNMEEKGRSFYEKAVTKCKNKLGREMFETLMKDEIVHVDRIKNIYTSLKAGKPWNDEWKKIKVKNAALSSFFNDLARKNKNETSKASASDIEAVNVGIDFEQKSVSFYEKEYAQANDPLEKSFAYLMIEEEKGHLKVLRDVKFYLSDPTGWYAEHEHSSYDAG